MNIKNGGHENGSLFVEKRGIKNNGQYTIGRVKCEFTAQYHQLDLYVCDVICDDGRRMNNNDVGKHETAN